MEQLYAAALLLASFGAVAAQTSKENMVFDRGQTRATAGQGSAETRAIQGLLVDSSCMNRSLANLRRTPEADETARRPGKSGLSTTPADSNVEAERAGAMAHQVPDQRSRQPDATCAVTGQTSSFGVLLDSGEYLTLDEGGNTKASDVVRGNAAGRDMLNGSGPSIKPRVAIRAVVTRGRAVVETLKLN